MSKQVFVADTILTASAMNTLQGNDYNQTVNTSTTSYVLVASDVGTRRVMNAAGSTTITVNTSLFAAGDTLFIQNIGAGTCTITAGTATVSTTGSLALAQYGGGTLYFTSAGVSVFQANGVAASASALTLISTTTIGTTVSSVTVSGVFSSTYDNYKIIISGGVSSTTNGLNFTLGSTTTGYYLFQFNGRTNAATVSGYNQSNGAQFFIGAGTTNNLVGSAEIYTPNLAKTTSMMTQYIESITARDVSFSGGWLDNSTQYTAFTIAPNTGTITGGTIKVYGFQNSQDYMTHKIQIDDLVRDATADEIATINARHAETQAQIDAQAAKNAARQAVLDKLGLTADEAQALLG